MSKLLQQILAKKNKLMSKLFRGKGFFSTKILFRGVCKRVYVGQINRWIASLRAVALINYLFHLFRIN